MLKDSFKIFLIALCYLSFFLVPPSRAENFILNSSFEDTLENKNPVASKDADGIKYWMRWLHQNNERSDIAAHTGKYSFKNWESGGIYQNFAAPIEKGKTYRISCYMYTPTSDRLKGGSYEIIKLEWLDTNGVVMGPDTVQSPHFDSNMPADTWHLISVQGSAPEKAVNGRAVLEFIPSQGGSGAIFCDDVEVEVLGGEGGQLTVSKEEIKKEEVVKEEVVNEKEDETIDWQW